MKTQDRLNHLLLNPPLRFVLTRPAVFFSDLHMGDGGKADDFSNDYATFSYALSYYAQEGYQFFLGGDIWELWQFKRKEIIQAYPALLRKIQELDVLGRWIQIGGNHDRELGLPEAALLQWGKGKEHILWCHGHQGDIFNDSQWKVGRFFTRYVWKPLELIGVKDPTSASKAIKKHDLVRKELVGWANDHSHLLICGHTHTAEKKEYYWNSGARTTCVEVGEKITLVRWEKERRIEI